MSFFNPKIFISTYFDSLIRQIDIYTEELLEKYTDEDVYEPKTSDCVSPNNDKLRVGFNLNEVDFVESIDDDLSALLASSNADSRSWMTNDSKKTRFNFFDFNENLCQVEQQQVIAINVKSYLNRVRDELIGELEKAQDQMFVLYEKIKHECKPDGLIISCDKEKFCSILFAKKFYFLLNLENSNKRKKLVESPPPPPFRLYLVELDFYLNENEQTILGYYFNNSELVFNTENDIKNLKKEIKNCLEPNFIYNKEHVLTYFLRKYLDGLIDQEWPIRSVIRVERKQFSRAKRLEISPIVQGGFVDVDLDSSLSGHGPYVSHAKYNFSNLKYLDLSATTHHGYDFDNRRKNEINILSLSLLFGLENLRIAGGFGAFSKLSKTLFTSLTSLRRLLLERCDLSYVPANALETLTSLQVLELRDCRNCSHVNLDVLPRLKWLILDNNNNNNNSGVSNLPSFRFLSPELLVFGINLKISESDWQHVHDFKHEKLIALDVKRDGWKLDQDWLAGFPSLKALKMDRCSLQRLELPSSRLSNLESLVLQHNQLESWDKSCRQLVSLKKLDLGANRMKLDRADVFAGLKSLSKLNISFNKLESIDREAFRGLDCLEVLDLSNNQLKHLDPEVFAYVPNLKHLNLSWNSLRIDNSTFCHLNRLKILHIGNNNNEQLISDEAVFGSLAELEMLDLSGNKLTKIDSNLFKGLVSLKRLVLNNNELSDIPADAFTFATSFEEVIMLYNRLNDKNVMVSKPEFAKIKFCLEYDQSMFDLAQTMDLMLSLFM